MRILDRRDLGVVVKRARRRRGFTQAQLARCVSRPIGGINQDAAEINISRWERGVHAPNLDRLIEIADALGLDLDVEFRERGQL